jgi:SAM-dependent methyltransferase
MPEPTSINYGQLAPGYDKSRRSEPAILSALIAGLRSLNAQSVLEIGAGTGNYSAAIAASGFALTAVDREPAMVAIGAAKAPASWIVADALHLPLLARSFDAAVAVNVLHHLPDLDRALAELRRVARCGAVMHAVVRENLATLWFRRYFPEIDDVLLPLHPPLGRLITALFRAGFSSVASTKVFYSGAGDLTFEAARTRPHLIFDPDFRAAVSGFRRLSSTGVARGLGELERDLESGAFASIAAAFDAAHAAVGDCVVIAAR